MLIIVLHFTHNDKFICSRKMGSKGEELKYRASEGKSLLLQFPTSHRKQKIWFKSSESLWHSTKRDILHIVNEISFLELLTSIFAFPLIIVRPDLVLLLTQTFTSMN